MDTIRASRAWRLARISGRSEQSGEKLKGLYPGQAKRETDRPKGKRVLEAVSRARITLTQLATEDGSGKHLTALPV
jgi:hypothetical protein